MAKEKKEQKKTEPESKKYLLSKDGTTIKRTDLSEDYIKSYEDRGWKVEEA